MKALYAAVAAAAVLVSPAAFAQDKPADNMAIVMEKVRADKKLVVAANMELTEQEAAAFWPVYEAYQKDLGALNNRIKRPSRATRPHTTRARCRTTSAKKLLDETLAIEASELDLKQAPTSRSSTRCCPPRRWRATTRSRARFAQRSSTSSRAGFRWSSNVRRRSTATCCAASGAAKRVNFRPWRPKKKLESPCTRARSCAGAACRSRRASCC